MVEAFRRRLPSTRNTSSKRSKMRQSKSRLHVVSICTGRFARISVSVLQARLPNKSGAPSLKQYRAVPSEKLPNHRNVSEKSELSVIPRNHAPHDHIWVRANHSQDAPNIGREQVFKRSVLAFAAKELVVQQVATSHSQIMKRREFMSTPRRQPVSPTQVEVTIRSKNLMK